MVHDCVTAGTQTPDNLEFLGGGVGIDRGMDRNKTNGLALQGDAFSDDITW
jgi:hypothetical protein